MIIAGIYLLVTNLLFILGVFIIPVIVIGLLADVYAGLKPTSRIKKWLHKNESTKTPKRYTDFLFLFLSILLTGYLMLGIKGFLMTGVIALVWTVVCFLIMIGPVCLITCLAAWLMNLFAGKAEEAKENKRGFF